MRRGGSPAASDSPTGVKGSLSSWWVWSARLGTTRGAPWGLKPCRRGGASRVWARITVILRPALSLHTGSPTGCEAWWNHQTRGKAAHTIYEGSENRHYFDTSASRLVMRTEFC